MLNVLIPARNEIYLKATIDDILAKARGDIKVIAVLDGYWPEPAIPDDKRVVLIHHTKPVGQRRAINEAARICKGKYILKTDAHTMFDEGFDIKLAADCEYNWTVIPRMYNLDIKNWRPKLHKKTDFMFIRSPKAEKKPFRHYYWDGSCKKEHPKEYEVFKQWSKTTGDIADVMTGQGACFFMHRDRFWELGGLDEAHGQWGQMGVEIALKAWLSGGSLKVNKKTWFAHWFRGGGGPGFPWPASGRKQHNARKYSIDFWTNEKWPLQKRPLSWLVKKFAPVPTWDEKMNVEKVYEKAKKEQSKWRHYSQQYAKEQVKNLVTDITPVTIKSVRLKPDSRWMAKAKEFNVEKLYNNRLGCANPQKIYGLMWLYEVMPPLIKRILAGEKFDDAKIMTLPYYNYLVSRLNPSVNPPSGPTAKGKYHCLRKVRDLIRLCYNVKNEGLKAPLDMYIIGKIKDGRDSVRLTRGTRRLMILHQLGVKKVPVRVWRNEWLARHYIPAASWPDDDGNVHACAVKQFVKYGRKASDKYWLHNYTPYYDNHLKHLRGKSINILELGVKRGMSLFIWNDAFPRARVFGLDNKPLRLNNEIKHRKNIEIIRGEQDDRKLLDKLAERVGGFNVIVDDASHLPELQRASLDILWPHLRSNGVYVIEDLETNYHNKYSETLAYKQTPVIPHLKSHIDNIWMNNETVSVAFYPDICFLTKA